MKSISDISMQPNPLQVVKLDAGIPMDSLYFQSESKKGPMRLETQKVVDPIPVQVSQVLQKQTLPSENNKKVRVLCIEMY